MIHTDHDHVRLVCLFHAGVIPGESRLQEPSEAQKILNDYERAGLVTREEAEDIRLECGWIQAVQLGLFSKEK